jgi:hypothetical protein
MIDRDAISALGISLSLLLFGVFDARRMIQYRDGAISLSVRIPGGQLGVPDMQSDQIRFGALCHLLGQGVKIVWHTSVVQRVADSRNPPLVEVVKIAGDDARPIVNGHNSLLNRGVGANTGVVSDVRSATYYISRTAAYCFMRGS